MGNTTGLCQSENSCVEFLEAPFKYVTHPINSLSHYFNLTFFKSTLYSVQGTIVEMCTMYTSQSQSEYVLMDDTQPINY